MATRITLDTTRRIATIHDRYGPTIRGPYVENGNGSLRVACGDGERYYVIRERLSNNDVRATRVEKEPMRVVGYTRVSKEKENGVSLDAQREQIEGYAKLYGYELADVIVDDGESGKSLERPGIRRALAMLVDGEAAGIIVAKLDRLTRSVRDLGELLEGYFTNGWILASVAEQIDTKTANGRMVLNILMSVAQWEREAISERTRTALAHKRAKGERLGGELPYGKRLADDGVHLEDNPDEQRVIEMVRKYRDDGRSIRDIVAQLKRRRVKSRRGRPLAIAQVHAIVKNIEASG